MKGLLGNRGLGFIRDPLAQRLTSLAWQEGSIEHERQFESNGTRK